MQEVWREKDRQEDRDEENRNQEDHELATSYLSRGGRKPPFGPISGPRTNQNSETRDQNSGFRRNRR